VYLSVPLAAAAAAAACLLTLYSSRSSSRMRFTLPAIVRALLVPVIWSISTSAQ
jgi:cobalamin biosynthesis protein CbiD